MYCSNCGQNVGQPKFFPWTCPNCGKTAYKNPIPVVVGLISVVDEHHDDGRPGLLVIRRSFGAKKGQWSLPGGFLDSSDANWQAGITREVFEETGLKLNPELWKPFDIATASDGNLLVFVQYILSVTIAEWVVPENNETDGIRRCTAEEELAFPLHTQVMRKYLGSIE